MNSLLMDIRYALRGMRRAPLFAFSVSSTIGLGLGVLCSAFTIVNAYLLTPIDLPDPHALYELDWDTASTRRRAFGFGDYEALRDASPHFSALAAGRAVLAMHEGRPTTGLLVTGNYLQMLGGTTARGRMLLPSDAAVPGANAVVVLSHVVWRTQFGADPAIVGKTVTLGRGRFDVVGVLPPRFGLPGTETMGFYAPITMAAAFGVPEPWTEPDRPAFTVVGRLRADADATQAHTWFGAWLRQRFPAGSPSAPTNERVESRATRIPLTGSTVTLLTLLVSAFGLVLLVACANVTNLILARGFLRQREVAVRLSLGANRRRVIRQLVTEGLVLAVPAAAIGFALTLVTARAFPALIAGTFPDGIAPVEVFLIPLTPDLRVIGVLAAAAVASAVLVNLAPAFRVTRADLVKASKGEVALDIQRSRLRTALVATQIGACALFLVSATALIQESSRVATTDPGLPYDDVVDIRVAPRLRADVVSRLSGDPAVTRVAAAWKAPLLGELEPIVVQASGSRIEHAVGFTAVAPEYFPLFDIDIVRGRPFTPREADDNAAVALVSAATAARLWPELDPIGQTLDVAPTSIGAERQPPHARVRIIGITEDVTNGMLIEGRDLTCVYFATTPDAAGEMAILARGYGDRDALRAAVSAAVEAVDRDAAYRIWSLADMVGGMVWVFTAFSATASLLGVLGLVLAFSGTYSVVAFLVAQRTREFGIRLALGATVSRIVIAIVRDTLGTGSLGLAAGVALAFAVSQLVAGNIPIISPFQPAAYLIGATVVLTATVAAALLPSIRTARIDPSSALRVD